MSSKIQSISSKKATSKDKCFARQVHHAAYHDVSVKQFGPWDEKVQDELFEKNWEKPDFRILSIDNIPCGYTRVEYLPDKIEIHELVVSPKFQNQGIGRLVLEKCKQEAQELGVPLKLQVLYENRAIKLYKRLGFKVTGKKDNHYLMELG